MGSYYSYKSGREEKNKASGREKTRRRVLGALPLVLEVVLADVADDVEVPVDAGEVRVVGPVLAEPELVLLAVVVTDDDGDDCMEEDEDPEVEEVDDVALAERVEVTESLEVASMETEVGIAIDEVSEATGDEKEPDMPDRVKEAEKAA